MSEQEKTQTELHEALKTVREAHEEVKALHAKGLSASESMEKVERAEKTLDKLEDQNQNLVKQIAEDQKTAEKMREDVKAMEIKIAKLSTSNVSGASEKQQLLENEVKNLKLFAEKKYSEVEKKYYRADSNEDGGFLMTTAYDDMIIKPITEVSPIRSVARNKRIDAFNLQGAARETLIQSFWTGEGEAWNESNSTYRSPDIPTQSLTTLARTTTKALLGGRWDLETEITSDMVESRAQQEGSAFVNGDGIKKPTGFLNGGLETLTTTTSGSYDFDDLIDLTGLLKSGYNPIYGMNRLQLAFMRKLKDSAGAYIWQAGNLGAGVPNQINGYGYLEIPDMPNQGSSTTPVVFADFMKMYTIVDSFQAIFLRNPWKTNGFVEFSLEGWVGGQVVLKEAGVLLECGA